MIKFDYENSSEKIVHEHHKKLDELQRQSLSYYDEINATIKEELEEEKVTLRNITSTLQMLSQQVQTFNTHYLKQFEHNRDVEKLEHKLRELNTIIDRRNKKISKLEQDKIFD